MTGGCFGQGFDEGTDSWQTSTAIHDDQEHVEHLKRHTF